MTDDTPKTEIEIEIETNPTPPEMAKSQTKPAPEEVGGPQGPEPTRFGDWEKAGRCSDF